VQYNHDRLEREENGLEEAFESGERKTVVSEVGRK